MSVQDSQLSGAWYRNSTRHEELQAKKRAAKLRRQFPGLPTAEKLAAVYDEIASLWVRARDDDRTGMSEPVSNAYKLARRAE